MLQGGEGESQADIFGKSLGRRQQPKCPEAELGQGSERNSWGEGEGEGS